MDSAAIVRSKAPEVIRAHEEGVLIGATKREWLAPQEDQARPAAGGGSRAHTSR